MNETIKKEQYSIAVLLFEMLNQLTFLISSSVFPNLVCVFAEHGW